MKFTLFLPDQIQYCAEEDRFNKTEILCTVDYFVKALVSMKWVFYSIVFYDQIAVRSLKL